MSRSPLNESTDGAPVGEADSSGTGTSSDRYFEGWADLNERLRRGEPWSGGEERLETLE